MSRAAHPLCAKCRSSRVIEYSTVAENYAALRNQGITDEVLKVLQAQEIRQLKLERALDSYATKFEEMNNSNKGPANPGPANVNLDHDESEKWWRESDKKRQDYLNKLRSTGTKSPQTKVKQTNPGTSR
ncbi:hypothetical protein EO98_04755 [Methanosarcina sp. 2.H.T.1A.6]|uniref:hypothetical protein n=1 Tax=unclassified Methanosarcina TaxID=2644672 RepID=UPI0006229267|nr:MULTISPECIES: hypothetical protein [unclassified Methanosarcina]KKG21293.1 hypothetical protein EO98_04755 [Methanosarcina sp. 2.H.T.1A.6]KKG24139.1 hypothetical protein EO96_14170 [Methanosarcina sp. 2.H.T.1A.8]KKG28684.1 hypothetical protein EO97_14840 [Methanosarcina sp. 2.H.T.1A.15]